MTVIIIYVIIVKYEIRDGNIILGGLTLWVSDV